MGEYVLTLLEPAQVQARWGEIERLLRPVEDHCHGELLVEDVPSLVKDRAAFVLALCWKDEMVLAGVFEVMDYPRKRVLNAIMVGGSGATYVLQHFKDQISNYARRLGCTAIRGYVRPAMARLLRLADPSTRVIYSVTEQDL